jgi:translation elongation factor EF-Tu-like GTPase
MMTMKPLFLAVIALAWSVAPDLARAQGTMAVPKTTLTGTLSSGRVAVGGETSGWTLSYKDKTGVHSIEVEFDKGLLSKVHDGDSVRITGTIVMRDRVERGKVRTLVASTVEHLPDVAR